MPAAVRPIAPFDQSRVPARAALLALLVIAVALINHLVLEQPPNYDGCNEDPPLGTAQDAAVRDYRVKAFTVITLAALIAGIALVRWAAERRARGGGAAPGRLVAVAVAYPLLVVAVMVLAPDDASSALGWITYPFVLLALAGIFVVAAALVALFVMIGLARRAPTATSGSRLELGTVAVGAAICLAGVPVAFAAAYLQGHGALFC